MLFHIRQRKLHGLQALTEAGTQVAVTTAKAAIPAMTEMPGGHRESTQSNGHATPVKTARSRTGEACLK